MKVPPLMDMIRALVAIPSASNFDPGLDQGNGEVIDQLASWAESLGCDVQVQPLEGIARRANLIATLGSGDGGLVLSGHADTVGCESTGWRRDPYRLYEEDGRLYGLGIADMKAFFALAIEAMGSVPPNDLRHPVVLVATADEECSMLGAKRLVEWGSLRGRFALIGEPTNLLPVRMHKGLLMESVQIRGRSGHSSNPDRGANALDGMTRVMQELMRWRSELQLSQRNEEFEVPFPTLNLGTIRGGDHPNRICGECELQIDIRPLPGMRLEDLRSTLRDRVVGTLEGTGLTVEVRSLFSGTEPMSTPSDSEIVRLAERITGKRAGAMAYGTEGPYFASMGMATLLLGPGDIAQAHQPNEYLALDRIQPGIDLLRAFIGELCA